jgi:hypothetical protein
MESGRIALCREICSLNGVLPAVESEIVAEVERLFFSFKVAQDNPVKTEGVENLCFSISKDSPENTIYSGTAAGDLLSERWFYQEDWGPPH